MAFQQPVKPAPIMPGTPSGPRDELKDYQVQLEPPGPQRLFRLESETALQERMRQEARERPAPERIQFPDEPILSEEKYAGRTFPGTNVMVEPNYVCHGRLFFEELNSERYGWDLGPIQPLVSAVAFYKDVVLLPYHLGTRPCQCYDCSAGYCLPGDPVPYMLYPPELSLTGAVLETASVAALFFIFP
jgi:hypothetical protein